jgi:hypothetical protein
VSQTHRVSADSKTLLIIDFSRLAIQAFIARMHSYRSL